MAFGKKEDKEKEKEKKKGRFQVADFNGMIPMYSVVVDTQTGVNYLVCSMGTEGVGVTVMLGADGKPIVTPVSAPED